jgi:hypothetical protein
MRQAIGRYTVIGEIGQGGMVSSTPPATSN